MRQKSKQAVFKILLSFQRRRAEDLQYYDLLKAENGIRLRYK